MLLEGKNETAEYFEKNDWISASCEKVSYGLNEGKSLSP